MSDDLSLSHAGYAAKRSEPKMTHDITQGGDAHTPGTKDDPMLAGLYSPSSGMVGCVLLAAAFGIRDRRVNNIFDTDDRFVAPVDDMFPMTARMSEWRFVASLPRNERPGPEHFEGRALSRATGQSS